MINKIKPKILTPLNFFFQPIERLWHNENDIDYLNKFPPTFIIGPPRSGTTVLYQLLCKHLYFGYVNNFVSNWPNCPITATKLYHMLYPDSNDIELISNFGNSLYPFGPNEFGKFWYRWFNQLHKLKKEDEYFLKRLKIEVSGLTKIHQQPLLFKNVVHSMRILDLHKIFNNSTFIVLKRKKIDIAQSILNAKMSLYNDKNHPFSVISSKDQMDPLIPYWKKIVSQINGVYFNIESAVDIIGSENFIFIDYKELCENTKTILKKIKMNFKEKGQTIHFKKNTLTNNLNYSTGIKVTEDDYNLLYNEINNE